MTHAQDPGEEHDAYLRSALRHAPDAGLVPPEALNEAILMQARSAPTAAPLHADRTRDATLSTASPAATTAAARPSVPPPDARAAARRSSRDGNEASRRSAWHPLAVLWGWLGQPAVASGLAGLMVATLVGVMWWGRPLDEALPQRAERPAVADRIASATAPAAPEPSAPSAPGAGAAATSREPDQLQQVRPAAAPDSPPPSMRDSAAAGKAPGRSAREAATQIRRAQAPNPSAATGPTANTQGAAEASNPSAAPTPPAAPAASPPEQIPQAFPSLAGPSTAPSTRARDRIDEMNRAEAGAASKARPAADPSAAAAPSSLGALRADAASADAPSAPRTEERRAMRMAESTGAARLALNPLAKSAQAVTAGSPLPALRAALAAEPGRWTWFADEGTVRPSSPELQRWLARLDAATLAAAEPATPGASAAEAGDAASAKRLGAARTLTLLRDGERHTMLRLGTDIEAIPQRPAEARWRARLSARDAAALQAGIPAQ